MLSPMSGYGWAISPKRRQVLRVLASGWCNHSIVEAMHISPKRVANIVCDLKFNLQNGTRADVVLQELSPAEPEQAVGGATEPSPKLLWLSLLPDPWPPPGIPVPPPAPPEERD
jgi:hypothetical protein